jgi:hypothetical protein
MELEPISDQLSSTPVPTHTDPTPASSGGVKFAQVLGGAVNVAGQLASTVGGAGGLGLAPLAGNIAGAITGANVGGFGGSSVDGTSFQELLLQQEQIQRETATFTAQTNISKQEHDTLMSAIRNIKD